MPPIYRGANQVDKCYLGANEIDVGMLGADEICSGSCLLKYLLAASYNRTTFMLQQEVVGVGAETCSHADNILRKDKDGIYHVFGQDVPVFEGMRTSGGIHYADDGGGILLPQQPWMAYQAIANNKAVYSNDQTQVSAWVGSDGRPVVTKNQNGLTGAANEGCLITANNTAEWLGLTQTFTVPVSQKHCAIAYVKKEDVTTRFPVLELEIGSSRVQFSWNRTTGQSADISTTGGYRTKLIDDGLNWKAIVEVTGDASDTTCGLVYYTCVGNTLGTLDKAYTGSSIVGNIEFHPSRSIEQVEFLSPILTGAVPEPTGEILYTFGAGNHDDAGYSYELDVRLLGIDESILQIGGADILSVVSGNIILSDGTNACSIPVLAAEPHINIHYSASDGMVLKVDEVIATSLYDGTLGAVGEIAVKATTRGLAKEGQVMDSPHISVWNLSLDNEQGDPVDDHKLVVPVGTNPEWATFSVCWGDGSPLESFGKGGYSDIHSHIYAAIGVYEVQMFGSTVNVSMRDDFMAFGEPFPYGVSRKQLIEVKAWGDTVLSYVGGMYQNCTNLTTLPNEELHLASENLKEVFDGCTSLTRIPRLITPDSVDNDFEDAFNGCSSLEVIEEVNFVGEIFRDTFNGCSSLTCIGGTIDTRNATNTARMFDGCTSLTAPNSADQALLLAGAIWTNPSSCP